MALTKVSYSMIVGAPVNVLDFGGATSAAIQAAIDYASPLGQAVYMPAGTYAITANLILKQGTVLFGDGDGTILSHTYSGSTSFCITDATTNLTASAISNIILSDFKIQGNGAGTDTWGIRLKYVNNGLIQNINVTGFVGGGIGACRAVAGTGGGNVGLGARNNKVINCSVSNITSGDGFSHAGYDVTYRDCKATSIGDTGFAIVADAFNVSGAATSSGTTYDNCLVDTATLGFAFGPFDPIGFDAAIEMIGCEARSCSNSLWAIQFDDLRMVDCKFNEQTNTTTGNVRLDNVGLFSIKGGYIHGTAAAGTGDNSCLMLNSDRLTYGASVYDSVTSRGFVGAGIVFNTITNPAILIRVGNAQTTPTFQPTSFGITINSAVFTAGPAYAINLKPIAATSLFQNLVISNCVKESGKWLDNSGGNSSTYGNVFFCNNSLGSAVTDIESMIAGSGVTVVMERQTGNGSPVTAALTPRCIGQDYFDSNGKLWWKSVGLTSADWKQSTN